MSFNLLLLRSYIYTLSDKKKRINAGQECKLLSESMSLQMPRVCGVWQDSLSACHVSGVPASISEYLLTQRTIMLYINKHSCAKLGKLTDTRSKTAPTGRLRGQREGGDGTRNCTTEHFPYNGSYILHFDFRTNAITTIQFR